MVAQRGIELHSRIQQRFIGQLEFLREIFWMMGSVNVITQHDDEVEAHLLTVGFHFLCHLILVAVAGSTVADYSKTDRLRL